MRPGLSELALPLFASLALLAAGCEQSGCDTSLDGNPPVDFRGGKLLTDAAGAKVYVTSLADGEHLNFAGGARYRIYHQLGGTPTLVQPWVSFSPTGTKGGNEAVPSGNMAEIIEINDQYVQVRNNTCGDYWLRLVASSPVTSP